MEKNLTKVELAFLEDAKIKNISTQIPFVTVESFPKLGLLSALSFIEWVTENPNGVVSLPVSKTAQYFINYTHFILDNWDNKQGKELLEKYGLNGIKKPVLSNLQFVQMGDFYPISSEQHNSLYNFAKVNYIEGFGLNPEKALLIKSEDIKLAENKHFLEVFPDYNIDLSLRFREAKTREKGGIGFFMGGIGPDGHIAFNTQGTDHFSTTRLTKTNFETQAVLAADLGGIEVSRTRLVITVGLGTIGFNPKAKAIVYAAGEAIADTIKTALESKPTVIAPATSLQKLENSRFYLTEGAAVKLEDSIDNFYKSGPWTHRKTERAVMELCKKINKFGPKLELDDLKADKYCRLIPGLNENTVQSVINSILAKLQKGMEKELNQVYYHTGPHHDDIMLGIMPATNRQSRDSSNELHFSVLTSGFTAVTNRFLYDLMNDTKNLINQGKIEMVNYPDFFKDGYRYKWDKDIYHYLDNIAAQNNDEKRRGVCHRAVRAMVSIWNIKSKDELRDVIYEILSTLNRSYDGSKNPPKIQKLKGMIREFEEELVWAHYGIMVKNVHHLRLSFYQGTSGTGQPNGNLTSKAMYYLFLRISENTSPL